MPHSSLNGRLHKTDLTYLGIVAISDPVRADVPAAVQSCLDAGIDIKIVTGDTPGTAKEIGRQIGTWKTEDTERNIITGPGFEALTDEEALDRVLRLEDHVPCPSYGQTTFGTIITAKRRRGSGYRRRDKRCPRLESGTGRTLHG